MVKVMIPVIIPYYLAPEKLAQCKEALSSSVGVEYELCVIDNSPPNMNYLYTEGVNIGLRKYVGRSDITDILVLSQDAYVSPDCLFQLEQFSKANPRAGICAPLQRGPAYGTGVSWAGSLEAWPAGRHIINKEEEMRRLGPQQTYWPNGAIFMIKTACLREIGLLDSTMRFICSDADIGFTARSRGWDVFCVPQATCEHSLDSSAKVSDPWLQRIKYEDMIRFTKKWASSLLYKELSYEGKNLTAKIIGDQLRSLERALSQLPK